MIYGRAAFEVDAKGNRRSFRGACNTSLWIIFLIRLRGLITVNIN